MGNSFSTALGFSRSAFCWTGSQISAAAARGLAGQVRHVGVNNISNACWPPPVNVIVGAVLPAVGETLSFHDFGTCSLKTPCSGTGKLLSPSSWAKAEPATSRTNERTRDRTHVESIAQSSLIAMKPPHEKNSVDLGPSTTVVHSVRSILSA